MASDDLYFSDREFGQKPRTVEEISEKIWAGIAAAIRSRLSDGSFGNRFPAECPDGAGVYGCDETIFMDALAAEMPEDILPLHSGHLPSTLAILDLIEFCHRHVAKPIRGNYHSFFRHHHQDETDLCFFQPLQFFRLCHIQEFWFLMVLESH